MIVYLTDKEKEENSLKKDSTMTWFVMILGGLFSIPIVAFLFFVTG